jgi:hypothetical protein
MNTRINEKVKSKNLEAVWVWKDKLSDDMRKKTFKEVKKILDSGIEEYKKTLKEK